MPAARPVHAVRGRARQCFEDPSFCAAVREMEALGLWVTAAPHAGSVPFDILAGRMRLRWYLVPPRPQAVRVASLALIQPLRSSSRIFKRLAADATKLGLPHVWRRARAHVSGTNRIAGLFGPAPVHAAFLTGTAGPHRKLAVQFMDDAGGIRGYAKVARAPATRALLANEAAALGEVGALALRSAVIPRVLLYQLRDGAAVLATDTARTANEACSARLATVHVAFLEELATRTSSVRVPDGGAWLASLRARIQALPATLPADWARRFRGALRVLAAMPGLVAPRGLAHGDFTPGNTFRHADRLGVFDWEYAGYDYPADYDLIHFLATAEGLRHPKPLDRCHAIEAALVHDFGRLPGTARVRTIAYLCAQAAMLAGRRNDHADQPLAWEGQARAACMLDALVGQEAAPS